MATVSVVVSPSRIDVLGGVRRTVRTTADTCTVAVAVRPPAVARRVVVPLATDVTTALNPLPATVATLALSDAHVTLGLLIGAPSGPSTVTVTEAVTCSPTRSIVGLPNTTVSIGGDEGSPPPQLESRMM